jgi:hypothetical protein
MRLLTSTGTACELNGWRRVNREQMDRNGEGNERVKNETRV